MKKVLLTIMTGVLSAGLASAQCTPDPAYAGESFGLWPDSLATVYTCVGCGDQTRIVDIVTLVDSTLSVALVPGTPPTEITAYIDAFKIVEVRNVPAGMSYGSDIDPSDPSVSTAGSAGDPAYAPWGIWYNEGTAPSQTSVQGCVYISGPESEWNALAATGNLGTGLGAVQLSIDVDVRIAATEPNLSQIVQPGTWFSSLPATLGGGFITIDDYWLVAQESSVGIVEVDESKFALVNNYIDGATGITNIEFNAPYNMEGLEFNVYSVLGARVHSSKFSVERGMNTVKFDGNVHSSGLYIFTISDGNTMLTSKMYTN